MDRRATRAWCFYDWANSAFATTVMAALFPPFFRELAIAAGRGEAEATALWGYVTAGALLLIAITAPVLGAVADAIGWPKRFLAFLAGLGILATGLFATLGSDGWRTAAVLYVAANFGFAGSIIFYESLLPSLARGRDMDRLSAQAYGLGYAGGGLLLVVNLFWVMHPEWFAMPDRGFAVRASFVSVAVWWGLFSLPLFKYVPEPLVKTLDDGKAAGSVLVQGFRRLAVTLREITRYRQLLIFLAAYWIYNDGIGTIVKMATAYGSEIGIGMTDLIGALVLTQAIGIPFAILFGRLARRTGPKPAILLALSVYLVISIFGFFLKSATQFYVLFASMVPRHRTSEFFGFYSSSGKLAGVAGPLVFGLVSQGTGTSRLGILSLIVFFAVGGWLLTRVDVSAGEAEARRAEREAGFQAPEIS